MATRRSRDRRGRRSVSEREPRVSRRQPSIARPSRQRISDFFTDPAEEATPRPTPRPSRRSETLARIAWAVPWIVFAIFIVAVGGAPFAFAMVGLACIGCAELFRMTAAAKPFVAIGLAIAAALILAAHFGSARAMGLAIVATFPLMFAFAITRPSIKNVTYAMGTTLFAIAWIAVPFAHAVLLRDLPDHGGALLIDVLVATLSPNKTVEGLIAGFIGGTMGFWFAGLYQNWLAGADALVMGAAIGLFAPMGDLFESMIKRDLDVKDSGRAFGPHG